MIAGRSTIDQSRARMILYEEAAKAAAGHVDRRWMRPIEAISKLAEESNALTHIAFLGTAILAKCTAPQIDVFSVKVSSGPNGYAARSLCQHVLATNAPELDIHLGVTGREPLNNQPYFRIDRLTREAPVRSTAQGVLNALCDLLDRLQDASEDEARAALRAFILANLAFEETPEGRRARWRVNLDALGEGMADVIGWPEALDEKSYSGPSYFLAGGASDYVDAAGAQHIHALFPNAAIDALEGAGHWLHAEQPDPFFERVSGWLRQRGM